MQVIEQSANVVSVSSSNVEEFIEDTARICYRSHDKRQPGSAGKLVAKLIDSEHLAMLEFVDMVVDFKTDRAVTHEIVRHRMCSFAQESQRYVRYGGDIEFVKPVGLEPGSEGWSVWHDSVDYAASRYLEMLSYGCSPQLARRVLPNSTATTIRVKANLREWRHIFSLRLSPAADQQIADLMGKMNTGCAGLIPECIM